MKLLVKGLSWQTFCGKTGNCSAPTVFGEYVIQLEDDLWMLYLPYQDRARGKGHDTLDLAKEAAQKDLFERVSAVTGQVVE